MNKNIIKIILIASILLISISNCTAVENEFGIVNAWSNDEPATVFGMELKINEPFTVKVTIESKIDGDICVQLYEPGAISAYEVVEGPSKIDECIDNINIESGWKTTYVWILKPNGDWTNANAPINLLVKFSKSHDDNRTIEFTIANPHILDEQYLDFNLKITNKQKLEDKYKLHLEGVDIDGSHAWIQLIKKNKVVDNLVISEDGHFELYDGDVLIVDGNCSAIFAGLKSCVIKLENVKQYDENGNIIFSQDIVMLGTKKKVKNR